MAAKTKVAGTVVFPDRFKDATNSAQQAVQADTDKQRVFGVRGP